LDDAEKMKTFLDLEDKTFNSWAERYLKEYEENVIICEISFLIFYYKRVKISNH
jgi:hypothetical protein